MSLQAITHVWEHSKQKGTHLLMMLALADYADEDGFSYAGEKKLARRCRTGVRNLQKISAKLQADGEIEVFQGGGIKTAHGHTNKYRIKGIGRPPEKGGTEYPAETRDEPQFVPGMNHSSSDPLDITHNTNTSGEQVAAETLPAKEETPVSVEKPKEAKLKTIDPAQRMLAYHCLGYRSADVVHANLDLINQTLKGIYIVEGLPDASKRTADDKERVSKLVIGFAEWWRTEHPDLDFPLRGKATKHYSDYKQSLGGDQGDEYSGSVDSVIISIEDLEAAGGDMDLAISRKRNQNGK